MSKKDEKEMEKRRRVAIESLMGGLSESAEYIWETPEEEREPKEAFKRFLWGAVLAGGKSYVRESVIEFLEESEE